MEKWFIKNRPGDVEAISKEFKLPNYISKILVNRGLIDRRSIESFINPSLEKLYDPRLLKDLDKAVNILEDDIASKNPIRIVGDYDVDGVMSSYILYTGLKRLGARVDYDIPHRIEDGYGINKAIIKKAYDDGIETILTCDNGIAAIEEIAYAKELGLKLIVTDHHDLPFEERDGKREIIYVEADAIVNHKRPDCQYPFKYLCGGALAFKLIQQLYLNRGIGNELMDFLEFAAIATICDVVDLVDENRIIASQGLKKIGSTKNLGLKALLEATELIDKEISVYHVGFIIGPCINASGRLDTATKAIDLLVTEDPTRAEELARELKELNDERKSMTEKATERIIEDVKKSDLKEDTVLLIYEPSIHESIAGIIAGRVKDKFHKPTIVLTKGLEGVKGSARSIEGYNIFEELTRRKNFLNRFGGHPMAAGLSLDEDKIGPLRESLNKNQLTEEDLMPKKYIELALGIDMISYELIKNIDRLAPFGKGNSRPLFGARGIRLLNGKVLGENRNVLKLTLVSEMGNTIEGMIFNNIDEFESEIIENYGDYELENLYNGLGNNIILDIIYYPSINEFRGNTKLQSIIESYRISN